MTHGRLELEPLSSLSSCGFKSTLNAKRDLKLKANVAVYATALHAAPMQLPASQLCQLVKLSINLKSRLISRAVSSCSQAQACGCFLAIINSASRHEARLATNIRELQHLGLIVFFISF